MLKRNNESNTESFNAELKLSNVLLVNTTGVEHAMLEKALVDEDFNVVASVDDPKNLVELVEGVQADIIVFYIESPEEQVLSLLTDLDSCTPRPVVMFAEQDAPAVIDQVIKSGVSAYVAAEIHPHRIRSIISVAVARFNEKQAILKELQSTKKQLASRKMVDRAKGLLMERNGMTEDEAYKKLRKMSMDKGASLAFVAETVVDVLSI